MFADWVDPAAFGLSPSELAPGRILGPLPAGEDFAVATVLEVEAVATTPLDRCRDKVLAAMKRDRTHEAMARAVAQLESAARIEVEDGAREVVAARIEAWLGGAAGAPASPAPAGGSG
jgi:hypothetical protein